MTERPIAFNAEMVRAILDGKKTETRRPLKDSRKELPPATAELREVRGAHACFDVPEFPKGIHWCARSPFGEVGDLLNVGEPLVRVDDGNGSPYAIYARDGATVFDSTGIPVEWRWKVRKLSSRYCPKVYRRIWLKLVELRVERIQSIKGSGALAEGVEVREDYLGAMAFSRLSGVADCQQQRQVFAHLWNSIYTGPLSWESNPWTWIVRFDVVSTTGRPE